MYELVILVNGKASLYLHFTDYEAMAFFAETAIKNNCTDSKVSFTVQEVEE